jgi:hypothetical protein
LGERERVDVLVLADGDVLRGERLARSLLADLEAVEGVDAQFAAPEPVADPGAKGPVLADASLWVFLTASASATSRVLVSAIQAWVERDRHRLVRVTMGKRTIEIPSQPTAAQERLVEAFLREVER